MDELSSGVPLWQAKGSYEAADPSAITRRRGGVMRWTPGPGS
jgi:hypothetical protein